MRALLAAAVLLVLPAAAAARPLDADRTFARSGILRLNGPYASTSMLALAGGGTLHVTDQGLMRLSGAGKLRALTRPAGGYVSELVKGLAVGQAAVEYGQATPLATWPADARGTLGEPRRIDIPHGSATPLRVIRRRGGYAVLVHVGRGYPEPSRVFLVALTADGALDTAWGEGGMRQVPRAGFEDLALAARPDGSLVVPVARCGRVAGRRRDLLYVFRFAPDGAPAATRRLAIGRKGRCQHGSMGEARVDGRGRVVIASRFGREVTLLRLRRDLSRDARFTVRIRMRGIWSLPVRLERLRGGRYAIGFTADAVDVPRGVLALVDRRGRRTAARRLKTTRSHPTSALRDLAVDRRGRLLAAGSLYDTDLGIREDYGQPHLAVWRLRTR